MSMQFYTVRIPFSFAINHNLKKRSLSESIVIRLEAEDGRIGFGEGAPRTYVTQESIASLIPIVHRLNSFFKTKNIHHVYDISSICDSLVGHYGVPSLACAIETALLDLFCQNKSQNIFSAMEFEECQLTPYSGIVPFLSREKLDRVLQLIKRLELPHIKVKVGRENDFDTLSRVREILGDAPDIRLDANRAWGYDQALSSLENLSCFNISAVEEPLQGDQLRHLPELCQAMDLPVILDETVCNLNQAKIWADRIPSARLILNLKISKCGGLRLASKIYQFAAKNNIDCGLGCNVGETMILSSMGRIFAQTHQVKYLEGSYATYFMNNDLGLKPIKFAKKGNAVRLDNCAIHKNMDKEQLSIYGKEISRKKSFPVVALE